MVKGLSASCLLSNEMFHFICHNISLQDKISFIECDQKKSRNQFVIDDDLRIATVLDLKAIKYNWNNIRYHLNCKVNWKLKNTYQVIIVL